MGFLQPCADAVVGGASTARLRRGGLSCVRLLGYAIERTGTGPVRRGSEVLKARLVVDPIDAPKVAKFLKARAVGVGRSRAAKAAGLECKSASSLIGLERNALTYAGCSVWNRS